MSGVHEPHRVRFLDVRVGSGVVTSGFRSSQRARSLQWGLVASAKEVIWGLAGRLSRVGKLPQAQLLGYLPEHRARGGHETAVEALAG
jgi:hypothetical protein